MFMRQSSTRLYVDARLSQNVLPVGGSFGNSSGLYPTELTGAVGIGW